MVQINGCFDKLNKSQQAIILEMAKGWANSYWNTITVCWYSNGSFAYIVTDKNGIIYPSELL